MRGVTSGDVASHQGSDTCENVGCDKPAANRALLRPLKPSLRRFEETIPTRNALLIYVLGAVAFALAAIVAAAYARGWAWTGFRQASDGTESVKTLWDWLQLLVIPVALTAAAFALNALQGDREHRREERQAALTRSRAADSAREDALAGYLQQMSALMLDRGLARSSFQAGVRPVARTLTLTVLRRLDRRRQGLVIRFLSEARLITSPDPKISLEGIDLRGADLRGADLKKAVLQNVKLTRADLRRSLLGGARFNGSDLRRANFEGASSVEVLIFQGHPRYRYASFVAAKLAGAQFAGALLPRAHFQGADVRHADFTGTNLERASFDRACLTRARFHSASLFLASLRASGRDVDFSRASFDRKSDKKQPPEGWTREGATFDRNGSVGSVDRCSLPP